MIDLWPLLLPAAAGSGWWMANRSKPKADQNVHNRLSREYVVGLNYLLNEQSDKAVDIFIKLLELTIFPFLLKRAQNYPLGINSYP